MTDITLARLLHVLAVVLWIGGVGMVTTVLLPSIRNAYLPSERFAVFHLLEARFARQARVTTAIVGVTGFYTLWKLEAWARFRTPGFWWMHAMVLTWLVFTLMLFVIEPLVLDRLMERWAAVAPEATFRRIEWLHRALLALSLLTVAGAVAGSWGLNLFDW